MHTLLRRRQLVLKVPISQRGQVATDLTRLPPNCRVLTGLLALTTGLPGTGRAVVTTVFSGVGSEGRTDAVGLVAATLAVDGLVSFTLDPGPADYGYYAYPIGLSDPIFRYQGFVGGWLNMGAIPVPVGQVTGYRLWRTLLPNLGSGIVVSVTHPLA